MMVVGEGFHPGAGQPHAEILLSKQLAIALGATIYVNLEPAITTDALRLVLKPWQLSVAKVVVGMVDPDHGYLGVV